MESLTKFSELWVSTIDLADKYAIITVDETNNLNPKGEKMNETKPTTITLGQIHEASLCIHGWNRWNGWKKLLAAIDQPDYVFDADLKISLGDVAVSNGAVDALWCSKILDWSDVEIRRYIIKTVVLPAVRRTTKHVSDDRVTACIKAVAAWCDGDNADLRNAADTAHAAFVADVTNAADVAYTAYAACETDAANAAAFAACAVDVADAVERQQQAVDIIAAFPPVILSKPQPER